MKSKMDACRKIRDNGRAFKLGDNCWIDPESKQKEMSGVDLDWVISRGPEWIVREVNPEGVWASYKIEHAPTFFDFGSLIAYTDA